jgi:hypothetical protein
MNRNNVMRAVPIFVGVLLCMTLMQTAFAAQYSPNLNTATRNPMVWNSPNSNTPARNPTVWNSPNLDAATGNPIIQNTNTDTTKTITKTSGSVPPSDLINNFIPLQSLFNVEIPQNGT